MRYFKFYGDADYIGSEYEIFEGFDDITEEKLIEESDKCCRNNAKKWFEVYLNQITEDDEELDEKEENDEYEAFIDECFQNFEEITKEEFFATDKEKKC